MNSHTVPPSTVADDEVLARFILHKRYIRNDGTLKPDLFIPHPHTDLSVTRHVGLEESSIWAIGEGGCHTTVKDTVRTGRCFGAGQTSTKDVRLKKLPRLRRSCQGQAQKIGPPTRRTVHLRASPVQASLALTFSPRQKEG